MISTILKTCVKPVTRDIPLVLAHQGAAGGTRQVAHVTTSTSGAAATVASTSASTACAQKLLHPICNLSIALYTQSPSSRTSPAAFSALEFTKQASGRGLGVFGLARISSTLPSNPCVDPFPPARRSAPPLPPLRRCLHPHHAILTYSTCTTCIPLL